MDLVKARMCWEFQDRVIGFRAIIDFPIQRLTVLTLHSYDDWNFQRMVRDRPFNLREGGGYVFLFRSEICFRTTQVKSQNIRIYFFLSRKARIFFPEFNVNVICKNSESDYFFFPPPKSEYFFQQHWESEYFFRKKTITPPFQVKWSFPQLNISMYIRLFLKPFLYFNILSIIWQLLLSVKWRHLFSCEVKTRRIYGMETNI